MFLTRENFKTLAEEFFLVVTNEEKEKIQEGFDPIASSLEIYLKAWDETDLTGRTNMFANFITAYGEALLKMKVPSEAIN